MENEIELNLTENEILAIVFALSEIREEYFRGCNPSVSYSKLADKITGQIVY